MTLDTQDEIIKLDTPAKTANAMISKVYRADRLEGAKKFMNMATEVRRKAKNGKYIHKVNHEARQGNSMARAILDRIAFLAISELPGVHAALHRKALIGDTRAIEMYLDRWDQDWRKIKAEMQSSQQGEGGKSVEDALTSVVARLSSGAPKMELTRSTTTDSISISPNPVEEGKDKVQ